jgi:hypothetical protein
MPVKAKKLKRERKSEVGCLAYLLALLSFIPLVGIAFGLSAIAWGIAKWRHGGKKLAAVGLAGILFTIAIYSYLLWQAEQLERKGEFYSARVQLAKYDLNELIRSIEYFKLQYGNYPQSLNELSAKLDGSISITDTTTMKFFPPSRGNIRQYYYELDGEHYYLLSVGADGKPFTQDDILPDISEDQMKNIGYRVKAASSP